MKKNKVKEEIKVEPNRNEFYSSTDRKSSEVEIKRVNGKPILELKTRINLDDLQDIGIIINSLNRMKKDLVKDKLLELKRETGKEAGEEIKLNNIQEEIEEVKPPETEGIDTSSIASLMKGVENIKQSLNTPEIKKLLESKKSRVISELPRPENNPTKRKMFTPKRFLVILGIGLLVLSVYLIWWG